MQKLLVVDDSVFSQKVTANLLKKYLGDVEIYFANDGEEGLVQYKSIKPDYTFLDLLMPRLNGRELTKLIKEYDSKAKIFVISADVQKSVREEMENSDILAYINKPFNDEKAKLVLDKIRKDKYE